MMGFGGTLLKGVEDREGFFIFEILPFPHFCENVASKVVFFCKRRMV